MEHGINLGVQLYSEIFSFLRDQYQHKKNYAIGEQEHFTSDKFHLILENQHYTVIKLAGAVVERPFRLSRENVESWASKSLTVTVADVENELNYEKNDVPIYAGFDERNEGYSYHNIKRIEHLDGLGLVFVLGHEIASG